MENKINLSPITNQYLNQFQVAQSNLMKLIEEERMDKRARKSKERIGVVRAA